MSKKRLFTTIVILFLIALGFFALYVLKNGNINLLQNNQNENNASPDVQYGEKIESTDVEDPFKNESTGINISSSVNPSQSNLPKVLPLYEVSDENLKEKDISDLATRLGFKGKAITTEDETGKTYFYSENIKSLWVQSKQRSIIYKTGIYDLKPLQGSVEKDEAMKTAKAELLKDKFIASEDDVTYNGLHLAAISAEGHSLDNTKVDVFVVSFNKKVASQFPENTFSSLGEIIVSLNYKLEVLSVSINDSNNVKELAKYPIKTDEEFIQSLSQAKVQSLDDGKISILELYPLTIRQIAVNKIALSYIEADNKQWQPVFVLTGSARLSDKTTTSAVLYLPAISSKYIK